MCYLAGLSSISGLNELVQGAGSFSTLIGVIMIAYYLVQCYFGYPIFRVIIVIQGVLTGLGIGAVAGSLISLAVHNFTADMLILILATIICGVVGGILAHALYKFGVFMYFFTLFALIAYVIGYAASSGNVNAGLIAGAVAGVIMGIIGVILDRHIIIGTTAVCYGFLAGSLIAQLTDMLWLGAVLGIVFIVTGIIVQLKISKKKNTKKISAQPVAEPVYPSSPAPSAIPSAPEVTLTAPGAPTPEEISGSAAVEPKSVIASKKFCPNCGAELDSTAKFCGVCGSRL